MNLRRSLDNFLDVLGLIGFTVRQDRRKDRWKNLDTRLWGPPKNQFELSIQARPAVAEAGAPFNLALSLRNNSDADTRAIIADWIVFYEVAVTGPDGMPLQVTPYGKRLLAVHPDARQSAVFPARSAVHNELPLSGLFDMSAPGKYLVRAECQVPGTFGVKCQSNEVEVIRSG